MVSLVGWQLAGLAGLLVLTAAIMAPSCTLAFVVARVLARYADHPWLALVRSGLVPLALGVIQASGVSTMRVADHGALTVAISLATAASVVLSTRNPLWALAAGTGVSVAVLNARLARVDPRGAGIRALTPHGPRRHQAGTSSGGPRRETSNPPMNHLLPDGA